MPVSDYLHNPVNFMSELDLQFRRMDLNGDGEITQAELSAFSKKPNLDSEQQALAKFMKEHLDDLTAMTHGYTGISSAGLDHLAEVLATSKCEEAPSATGAIARGAAGGAAGGAAAAYLEGDKPGHAAGTGAAVGAIIGALAYGAAKSQYDELIADRRKAVSWNYFDFIPCSSKPLEPGTAHEVAATKPAQAQKFSDQVIDDQLANLSKDGATTKAPLEATHSLIDRFRSAFPRLDFNGDGYVTRDELKEAIANDYLSPEDKSVAAILAKHMDEVGSSQGITSADLAVLSENLESDDHTIISDQKWQQRVDTIVSSVPGCVVGGIVGAIAGNPIAGCVIGAGIASGGAYFLSKPNVQKLHQDQQSYRDRALAGTIADLKRLAVTQQKP